MKGFFFALSYVMGISVLFFKDQHLLTYLFILFLYLAFTDYFAPMFHRILVIDPLVLAYCSVLLLSLLEGIGDMVFVKFLLMGFFLFIYHRLRGKIGKEHNEKEEVTIHFYVKRLVLPLVYPVAFYFVIHFFLEEQYTLLLFCLFYFFVVMYFTKYIQTVFYFGYFVISQLLVLALTDLFFFPQ